VRFDTGSPKVCRSIRTAAHWVRRDGGPGLFPCPCARVRSIVRQMCDRLAWTFLSCRLFRAPSPSPRLAFPFGSELTAKGFVPSSRLHRCASTRDRDPHPASVPSSGVLSLSTVFSALRLRGLFHPRAASRTLTRPFRGFSPRAGPPARRRGRSPMPLARLRSPASQPGGHGALASTSRLCSARVRVLAARVIHPNGGRSPLRFSLLQAHHLPDRARIPPSSSARGVPDCRSSLARWPTIPAHSVFVRATGRRCLQLHRPARVFEPELRFRSKPKDPTASI
jgi:hypothetical protein